MKKSQESHNTEYVRTIEFTRNQKRISNCTPEEPPKTRLLEELGCDQQLGLGGSSHICLDRILESIFTNADISYILNR